MKFFKVVLATMLGFVLSTVVLIVLFILLLVGLAVSVTSSQEEKVASGTVLQLSLDHPIMERSSGNPLSDIDWSTFKSNKQPGLNEILAGIRSAAKDPNIAGIYMEVSSIEAGVASIEEIRNALKAFRASGKFVYTYGEQLTQGAYYLASVSDRIFLNPQGQLDFRGLRTELMFYKGAFEKLEIEPEVIRHGKYKSFVEPYIMDKMSPENRAQLHPLVFTIWDQVLTGISTARKIDKDRLNQMAETMQIRTAEDALREHFVDTLSYYDGVLAAMRSKLGIAADKKIPVLKFARYEASVPEQSYDKDKIAVIYANGEISGGNGDDNSIGSDRLAETIRNARLDDHIKAIVLRVNSPGGSALASDIIWRELDLTRKTKPVVACMGDVAASGGYYIACAADKIVAQPNTVTGSIGVLGILFNAQKLLNNKLGITIDTLKTNSMADFMSFTRPLTAAEKSIMQQSIEHVYDVFVSRVAAGRKMSAAAVDSIGQGRVWIGRDALRIGLVDTLGGMQDAINIAKHLAKLDTYQVVELPARKEAIKELIEGLTEDARTTLLGSQLTENEMRYFRQMRSLLRCRGIQARMPMDIEFY